MSEQTTSSGPGQTGQNAGAETGGACCAGIADLRRRAEQAAALRAEQTASGADGTTPSPAPSGAA
ncbi:hypothetical protein OHS59_44095 [Streptomyces sp. NBC_00414]|uniref:Uncharacterized protein n=1 Tax=Streptomyces liliiviolaceus TaxID=2823109 RepID=A0A940XVA9_9ACTN|nr:MULTISPECIES: hypothetical protein [Streptomyces]MBQ0850580.1 hypothetical protein [Streptomyces liliiviolaceus]